MQGQISYEANKKCFEILERREPTLLGSIYDMIEQKQEDFWELYSKEEDFFQFSFYEYFEELNGRKGVGKMLISMNLNNGNDFINKVNKFNVLLTEIQKMVAEVVFDSEYERDTYLNIYKAGRGIGFVGFTPLARNKKREEERIRNGLTR